MQISIVIRTISLKEAGWLNKKNAVALAEGKSYFNKTGWHGRTMPNASKGQWATQIDN